MAASGSASINKQKRKIQASKKQARRNRKKQRAGKVDLRLPKIEHQVNRKKLRQRQRMPKVSVVASAELAATADLKRIAEDVVASKAPKMEEEA